MKNRSQLIVLLTLMLCLSGFSQTIPFSTGRLVVSSDGNEHDHDDWAATPFTLALLAAYGLQDQLTVYTFSDHIWGSNHDKNNAQKEMQISALQGGKRFHFNNTQFIEAVADSTKAIQAIVTEINSSSRTNPLTIVAAGPMQVVGSAIAKSDTKALPFVRVISHSSWNDNHSDRPNDWEQHSGWTWKEIKSEFEAKGLICDRIVDQNGGKDYDGMKTDMEKFDWIKTSPLREQSSEVRDQFDWLYSRQETCIKKGDFDPSDAGMIIYLLTGVQHTNPIDAQRIMEHPNALKNLTKK